MDDVSEEMKAEAVGINIQAFPILCADALTLNIAFEVTWWLSQLDSVTHTHTFRNRDMASVCVILVLISARAPLTTAGDRRGAPSITVSTTLGPPAGVRRSRAHADQIYPDCTRGGGGRRALPEQRRPTRSCWRETPGCSSVNMPDLRSRPGGSPAGGALRSWGGEWCGSESTEKHKHDSSFNLIISYTHTHTHVTQGFG